MSEALPSHTSETLQSASVEELMRLLQRDEDRAPRNLVDQCAARGEPMLDAIQALLDKDYYWGEDQSDGEWWRLLHAVMILGLMESQRAGELLVAYMRRIDDVGDEALQEWLSGEWPALFRNKPREVLDALHALADDPTYEWHVRADAAVSAVAWTARHAPAELEQALDRIARTAFSKNEHFDLRVMLGSTLLAFARAKDRRALEQLSDAQRDDLRWFGREDIVRAYALGGEAPDWTNFENPWEFYEPSEIEARRKAREEAPPAGEVDDDYVDEPYVRESPKVGRNDPCSCGSGKKYKKCCGVTRG